jgi:hypothetical protein
MRRPAVSDKPSGEFHPAGIFFCILPLLFDFLIGSFLNGFSLYRFLAGENQANNLEVGKLPPDTGSLQLPGNGFSFERNHPGNCIRPDSYSLQGRRKRSIFTKK